MVVGAVKLITMIINPKFIVVQLVSSVEGNIWLVVASMYMTISVKESLVNCVLVKFKIQYIKLIFELNFIFITVSQKKHYFSNHLRCGQATEAMACLHRSGLLLLTKAVPRSPDASPP